MALAADPLYRDFGPTLLAEHLERSFDVDVSVETLRRWMLEDGLWRRRRRRAKHRRSRERRAALGELGQWDSSVHRWLEDRAGEFVLISIHDDATSRLMTARFVERDDGAENRRAIIGYLRRHGRPLAVYTDHAGHFGQWLSRKEEWTDTIIARGLGVLAVAVRSLARNRRICMSTVRVCSRPAVPESMFHASVRSGRRLRVRPRRSIGVRRRRNSVGVSCISSSLRVTMCADTSTLSGRARRMRGPRQRPAARRGCGGVSPPRIVAGDARQHPVED